MKAGFEVDRSEWPVVMYVFEGDASEETTRLYVEAVAENLRLAKERGHKYVSIVITDSMKTSAANRKAIADSVQGYKERIAAACLGNALVTTSAMARGLLTALRWVMTMPVPIEVFTTLDEAKAWAQGLLKAAAGERTSSVGSAQPADARAGSFKGK